MAIQEKIYGYFDRNPRLRVLFVFDDDVARNLTSELQEVDWKDGYRFVEFDGLSWLGTKYKLENEWQDEKVVIVFHQVSPNDPTNAERFPLMGLLVANAEYKSQSHEQFLQQHNISSRFSKIVKAHIDEFDREKFAKILRPYFNPEHFTEDVVFRGLMSGYLGETKLLSWDDITLRVISFIGDPANEKKVLQLNAQLTKNPDVKKAFISFLSCIFGEGEKEEPIEQTIKRVAQSMKYNAIAQLLPKKDNDNYYSLRITDSIKLDNLNRLLGTADAQPKQRMESYKPAFDRLSSGVKEDEILKVYGPDAEYYRISDNMADAIVKALAEQSLISEPSKVIERLVSLGSSVDENSDIAKAVDYILTVAKFYDKKNRLGSVTFNSPDEYIEKYTSDLYLFDTYYRESIAKYQNLNNELECYPVLEEIKKRLDGDYAMLENRINSEWVKCLKEKGNGYGEITKAIRQEDYFKTMYDPSKKQAVIICDAFRYELAKGVLELMAKNKRRYIPDLQVGIAMLPTETKYCKSALLPHDTLELMDTTLAVDHSILNDTMSRVNHLQGKIENAGNVDFETVLNGSKSTIRPLFTGGKYKVLFYDEVDHTGHGSTPRKVVGVCETAIKEIEDVINRILNHGNVDHVYLTSDHGFLYNDMNFEEQDKLDVDDEYIEKKSRYYLTTSTKPVSGITKFPLGYVSGMKNDVSVGVPTGTNRIKVRGGDYNFAHGGASLQEVLIPMLHVYAPNTNEKQKTCVSLIGKNLSIVSSRLKVSLLQEQAVSDTVKERIVKVGIYKNGELISNKPESEITLNSTSPDNLAERIFEVNLTLMKPETGLLQLRVYDIDDSLNPLITEKVTNNTLIERDF